MCFKKSQCFEFWAVRFASEISEPYPFWDSLNENGFVGATAGKVESVFNNINPLSIVMRNCRVTADTAFTVSSLLLDK